MIFIVWVDNIMTPVVGGFGLGRETTQIFFLGGDNFCKPWKNGDVSQPGFHGSCPL